MSGPLNHNPAEVIVKMLEDNGYCTYPSLQADWAGYTSYLPDTPDNAICTYDTVGLRHGRTMPDGETQMIHGVQVSLRGVNDGVVRQKARAIYSFFDLHVHNASVLMEDGSVYQVIAVHNQGDPISLGTESTTSTRRLYTLNTLVSLRMVSVEDVGTGS